VFNLKNFDGEVFMGDRNSVLLVHGINDTTKVFRSMQNYLQVQGWDVHTFNMTPNNGDGRLDDLAKQVDQYQKQHFAPDQKIDLVGFSMGGVISRYYLQRLGGIDKVDRFINIAAPNYGTQAAYLSQRPGCMQMRPDSEFLTDLNQDGEKILSKIKVSYVWTPLDLMIIPPQSCQMPFGKEIKVTVPFHGWVVKNTKILKAVAVALLD